MAGMPDPLTDLPPPSRFDPEDLNSFALGPESVEISPPFIVWAPSMKKLLQSGVLQPSLLLLSQSNVGAHLLHNLPGKRIIGSIIFPDISMVNNFVEPSPHNKECYLFAVDSDASVVLVSAQYSISPEHSSLWTKTVFKAIQPSRVLILGTIASQHFRGKLSADDPLLFVLETDEQKSEDKDQVAVAPFFPSGSLVDGVAAALITHCQIQGQKACLLMSWPDTNMSVLRLLVSAITTLIHRATPHTSALNFMVAREATEKRRIQSDSELYV
ncbi:hypothetical protein CY35_02G076000 [Sphagnum magellanicum]|nr:hypothetical protein CY35_02G076000 [Sphagnum magellanicum]